MAVAELGSSSGDRAFTSGAVKAKRFHGRRDGWSTRINSSRRFGVCLPKTTSHMFVPRKLPGTITQTPPRPSLTDIPSNLNPGHRPPPRGQPRRTTKQHLHSCPRSSRIDDSIPEPHEWEHDARGVRERDRDQRGVNQGVDPID